MKRSARAGDTTSAFLEARTGPRRSRARATARRRPSPMRKQVRVRAGADRLPPATALGPFERAVDRRQRIAHRGAVTDDQQRRLECPDRPRRFPVLRLVPGRRRRERETDVEVIRDLEPAVGGKPSFSRTRNAFTKRSRVTWSSVGVGSWAFIRSTLALTEPRAWCAQRRKVRACTSLATN